MSTLLYAIAWLFVKGLQALPLRGVAWLGRWGGAAAYHLDPRHRRVVQNNLHLALGKEKSPQELAALAREIFRRLGENYACAVKTASMTQAALYRHLEITGWEGMREAGRHGSSLLAAIGHFGNFELYARANRDFPEYQFATTYRALPQPKLDKLLHDLRASSGCLLFERRRDRQALIDAMHHQRLALGFLSDQRAGKSGVLAPFFGHDCATTMAPAIFALRYKLPLFTAFCFRTRLAHWRIEIGPEIPTRLPNGDKRSIQDIMIDVNQAFESAVRKDPANWFWVHDRWKLGKNATRKTRGNRARQGPLPQNPQETEPFTEDADEVADTDRNPAQGHPDDGPP